MTENGSRHGHDHDFSVVTARTMLSYLRRGNFIARKQGGSMAPTLLVGRKARARQNRLKFERADLSVFN
jgi:hypothetical protein